MYDKVLDTHGNKREIVAYTQTFSKFNKQTHVEGNSPKSVGKLPSIPDDDP